MTHQVTFTLDGDKVTADKGMTIWEVSNGRGLVIPHLCHKPQPGYRPDGNCRACMVEIEGERTLAASCIREPMEGMVVNTATPRAEAARKMVVEMLVTDQPEKEVSHDQSSHLWDMAEANGVSASRFPKLEDGRIASFGQDVKACALGQAAASVVGANVLGQNREGIEAARDALKSMLKEDGPTPSAPFDGLEVLRPARDYKNRHASIMLALDATAEAFDAAEQANCA